MRKVVEFELNVFTVSQYRAEVEDILMTFGLELDLASPNLGRLLVLVQKLPAGVCVILRENGLWPDVLDAVANTFPKNAFLALQRFMPATFDRGQRCKMQNEDDK